MWIVNVKGECGENSWEICVVRDSNAHGIQSYGWYGKDKYLVASSGGPCHDVACKFVWDSHLQTAADLCKQLNDEELERVQSVLNTGDLIVVMDAKALPTDFDPAHASLVLAVSDTGISVVKSRLASIYSATHVLVRNIIQRTVDSKS